MSQPITEKHTQPDESNAYLKFSFAEMQGNQNIYLSIYKKNHTVPLKF